MQNRGKLIELFIYVLVVVIGIILLLTSHSKVQEIKPQDGGVGVAAVFIK